MTDFYADISQIGNTILHTYYSNGKRYRERVPFAPSLYTKSQREEPYKTIFGENVAKLDFMSIDDAKLHIKQYKDVANYEMYGNNKWDNNFLATTYTDDSVYYNFDDLQITAIDIETTTEYGQINVRDVPEEILLITLISNKHGQITFGSRPYSGVNKPNYVYCADELSLLKRFLEYWVGNYPDIITGWNSDYFDLVYLIRRMENILGAQIVKSMSPWKIIREKSTFVNNKEAIYYDIYGIQSLDYMALYKKFRLIPRENYRLDTICEAEIGTTKVKNPGNTFKEFYTDYWETFVDYNVRDVTLIIDLEAKLKLLEVATTMAYTGHVNYIDVFSPVRLWEAIINSYLLNQNIIQPLFGEGYDSEAYDGAYVKTPLTGLKGWLASFDAASLYPSIIMQYNISPETLVDERIAIDIDKILSKEQFIGSDYCTAANGTQYRMDKQGFLPALMRRFFDNRVLYKTRMLDAKKELEYCTDETLRKSLSNEVAANRNKEQAIKISINALYGGLANAFFKFFDVRLAEAITLTGQTIIKWGDKTFNDYYANTLKLPKEDYVIYCDTDSLYVDVQPLVDKFYANKTDEQTVEFIDKICKSKFKDLLEHSYKDFFEYTNGFEQTIYFKRENICSKGLWVAKKKYLVKCHDSEGVRYAVPDIKITGLEMVRSSTPGLVRKSLKECVGIILNGDINELRTYTDTLKKEFFAANPIDIAFPRGMNNLEKWSTSTGGKLYKSGTPIAVRAAILFNHYIKENKLQQKYSIINSGDKLRFIYLNPRNPIKENLIGFLNEYPEEIVSSKYIDYELQWKTAFLAPLENILNTIGWQIEETLVLDSFFF